jgi:hypothetical protein
MPSPIALSDSPTDFTTEPSCCLCIHCRCHQMTARFSSTHSTVLFLFGTLFASCHNVCRWTGSFIYKHPDRCSCHLLFQTPASRRVVNLTVLVVLTQKRSLPSRCLQLAMYPGLVGGASNSDIDYLAAPCASAETSDCVHITFSFHQVLPCSNARVVVRSLTPTDSPRSVGRSLTVRLLLLLAPGRVFTLHRLRAQVTESAVFGVAGSGSAGPGRWHSLARASMLFTR